MSKNLKHGGSGIGGNDGKVGIFGIGMGSGPGTGVGPGTGDQ